MVYETSIGAKTCRDLATLTSAGILKGFYLAGGTGLALHLGHRISVDLDFFSREPFNADAMLVKLLSLGKFTLDKKEEGTLTGMFESTLLSLFYYPYSLLEPTLVWEEIQVSSVRDIACMKLDAVASRGTKKDYIDLYCIVHKNNYTLKDLLSSFERKYENVHYNLMHVKKSLVYFADAETDPIPRMNISLAWEDVKKFFEKEIRKLEEL